MVTNITISSTTSVSTTITWDHAQGDKDGYEVSFICAETANINCLDDTKPVDKTLNTFTHSLLAPGSLYTISITTIKSNWTAQTADANDNAQTGMSQQ